ncbi:MAG: hypothetical protein WDZ51_14945 [Pirellulaceae bacterium]
MIRVLSCALLVTSLALSLGCTSETGSAPAAGDSKPAGVTKANPGPAGDPTPPLDGGRVETTLPQGWKLLPKRNEYLAAAYHEDKTGVPRILLTSTPSELPDSSSADQLAELESAIQKELGPEKGNGTQQVQIGDHHYVRHDRTMKFRGLPSQGISLETVKSGHRYKVELQTYTDEVDTYLPALYRMAVDLKVSGGEPAVEPPAEETDEAPPQAEEEDEPADAS